MAANKKLDITKIHSRLELKANELAKYGAKNKKIGKLRQWMAHTIESKTPTFSIAKKLLLDPKKFEVDNTKYFYPFTAVKL